MVLKLLLKAKALVKKIRLIVYDTNESKRRKQSESKHETVDQNTQRRNLNIGLWLVFNGRGP